MRTIIEFKPFIKQPCRCSVTCHSLHCSELLPGKTTFTEVDVFQRLITITHASPYAQYNVRDVKDGAFVCEQT